MTRLLIGHRGTGKTSFLHELKRARPDLLCVDLDEELIKIHGVPVAELFAQGEPQFRALEREALERLMKDEPAVIALGAGFTGPLPAHVQVVWLRRVTDGAGRSFLSRPRLQAELSPLEEYHARFLARDQRFAEWAHEELFIPEGYDGGLAAHFFAAHFSIPGDVTLLPENFRNLPAFLEKRRVRRWEIRDDLLSSAQIHEALTALPKDRLIYARRLRDGATPPPGVLCDWALELGVPPSTAGVVSLHERAEDFAATLEELTRWQAPSRFLKLAVEVKDFTELQRGHHWWQEDPGRRSFLPWSSAGTWRWYRSFFGAQMPLNYWREGQGSSLDQPLLWQALLQPDFKGVFAAVLGEPVEHSRTPYEQRHLKPDIPVVAIEIPENEFAFALHFLAELGLRYAAVTAPLKKLAWAQATQLTPTAREMQAANTLFIREGRIFAHNTDVLALNALHESMSKFHSVWLWGGGGIKSSVKAIWPAAREVSGRQGIEDPLEQLPQPQPDLVIWATGRGRRFAWPPKSVRPRLILDLNYGEDSPGLEWAVRENLPYESGLKMFRLQAEFQRAFWRGCDTDC